MIQEVKFVHNISKGSKFNQIYIPRQMESAFEVGDFVEVKLIEKKNKLFYSDNLKKLSSFKVEIIKKIFALSETLKKIKQVLFFGSFLTSKNEYHDIDILLISDEKGIDSTFYKLLNESFDLKFHIISVDSDRFENLLKICPLTRSMLYYSVSNNRINSLPEKILDKRYLLFLLMLPEDLLDVELNNRIFYEALRRLISIKEFIFGKDIDPRKIDDEISKMFGKYLTNKMRENEMLDSSDVKRIRKSMKLELNLIHKKLKNEQE